MLTGGKGDDSLFGGAGDDNYIFNFGDGNDIIVDSNSGENDSIEFNGYNFEDAIFTSLDEGIGTLLVSFENSTDSIAIRQGTDGFGAGVEIFEFDDMTVTLDEIGFVDDLTPLF